MAKLGTIKRGQNVNIIRGWLEFQVGNHVKSKDTPIIVYCGKNLRSPLAENTLGNIMLRIILMTILHGKGASDPVKISDYETENILYRKSIQIAKNIYSVMVLLSHLLARTQTIITIYHSL